MTDDEQSTENASPAAKPHEVEEAAPKPHTSAPKTHEPALAITGVVLGMLVLSALAILIYLNS
jgi:hypothetical protein